MNVNEARKLFIDFYRTKKHTIVHSSSLIPANDPTLLFVNAGMVPFKDVFTGMEEREYSTASSSQRCMRVSGKHNDLEDVGKSIRHTTFFEMLGNFSFGAYFKEEAIQFAWEFVTKIVGFDPNRIYPTVFKDDDEAFQLWQDIAGLPKDRITRLGEKENFWTMGDTGPCGPCSELIYDRGIEKCTCGRPDCHLKHDDCDRWMEFWNLVFMQFEQKKDGSLIPLEKPCVDTAMGLERLVILYNDLDSIYEIDIFKILLLKIRKLTNQTEQEYLKNEYAYRAIADHARATTFLILDRVMPGNEGRNYILRMLMRRAIRFGKILGIKKYFLTELAEIVIETMGVHYKELVRDKNFIMQIIREEEERFQDTLSKGLVLLNKIIKNTKSNNKNIIDGNEVFQLYDTFGFPHMLTQDIAAEQGLKIDELGFQKEMKLQKERSRAASKFSNSEHLDIFKNLTIEQTNFLGYEEEKSNSKILALIKDEEIVEKAVQGDKVVIILDKTPFYPESGGQQGDTGYFENDVCNITITDTQKPISSYITHHGKVKYGEIKIGQTINTHIDSQKRTNIARNHSTTHILHKVLQELLGEHIQQAGSLVGHDRLRFDYTHPKSISKKQIQKIENLVNEKIRENLSIKSHVTTYNDAINEGATALFGEKYSDNVRVIQILQNILTDNKQFFSSELCGGIHVANTGEIGQFIILNEMSIGTGIHRIEALTGEKAEKYIRNKMILLEDVFSKFKSNEQTLLQKIDTVLIENKDLKKNIDSLNLKLSLADLDEILNNVKNIKDTPVLISKINAKNQKVLKEISNHLKDKIKNGIIILGTIINEKPMIEIFITPEIVNDNFNASILANKLGKYIGGSGGGQSHIAKAGGKDASKLKYALEKATELINSLL